MDRWIECLFCASSMGNSGLDAASADDIVVENGECWSWWWMTRRDTKPVLFVCFKSRFVFCLRRRAQSQNMSINNDKDKTLDEWWSGEWTRGKRG